MNEDIVINNIAEPAPAAPSSNEPVAAPASEAPAKPYRSSGYAGTPGIPDSDFSHIADDDEMDFFIPDKTRPEVKQEASPAGDGEPEVDSTPPPAAPKSEKPAEKPATVPPPPAIDPQLISMAETFGMSKEEASAYDQAGLIRTLNILARKSPPAPVKEAVVAPAPEPALDFPTDEEMAEGGFDPALVKAMKATRIMHDRFKAKLDQLDKVVPNLAKDAERRQQHERQQAVARDFKDAGYDIAGFDGPTINRIVARVSGLYQVYAAEGSKPPIKDLIRTAINLVKPDAKPAADPAIEADSRRKAAAERARQMDRTAAGQFVAPTHRRGGNDPPNGSRLREFIHDKGGEPGGSVGRDDLGMLPG